MKRMLVPLLTTFLLAAVTFAAEEPTGTLNLTNAEVNQVLTLYKTLSGLELILDSRIKTVRSAISLQSAEPLSRAEAIKRMEKALQEQAGVVITRLDAKRASVTYNDALPRANQRVGTSVGSPPAGSGQPAKVAPQGFFPGEPTPGTTSGLRVGAPPADNGQPAKATPKGFFPGTPSPGTTVGIRQ